MKNLFNIGFVVLVLVVLGCNCQKFKDLAESQSTPTPSSSSSPSSTSTPTDSSSPSSTSSPTSSKSGSLSKEKYDQLKDGMTYKEVVGVLGKEGEETSSSKVGSTTIRTLKWQGVDYEYIFVNFTNDKMTFKSQANLK